MILTSERFKMIGEALFGPRGWHAVLAQMIGKDRTAVWRYATGDTNVPPDLRSKLAAICRTRGEALIRIARELDPTVVAQRPVASADTDTHKTS